MKNKHKTLNYFFLIFLLFTNSLGLTQQKVIIKESVEWQKIQLEEKLYKKVDQQLGAILDKKNYIIKVDAIIDEEVPLRFDANENIDDYMGSIDFDRKYENENNKDINGNSTNENEANSKEGNAGFRDDGIKVSDIQFDESNGDYIAFSKIGLEVPIVEKYMKGETSPRNQNGKASSSTNQNEKKFETILRHPQEVLRENIIKDTTVNKKYFEYLYRYNKAFDLFDYITDIKIDVILDKNLPEEIQSITKRVLRDLKISVAGIEPAIKVKVSALSYTPKPKKKVETEPIVKKKTFDDYLEWVSKFANVIAAILGSLLLGVIGFVLISFYFRKMEQRNLQESMALNMNDSGMGKEDKEETAASAGIGGDLGQGEPGDLSINGAQRFEKFWSYNKQEALVFLKNVLGESSKESQLALTALAQQLDNDVLREIFSLMSEQDRSNWKDKIQSFLTPEDLKRADTYISEKVVSEMIVPSAIKDPELVSLIMNLSPEQGVHFVQSNPEYGAILLNLMNTQYSSNILAKLTPEESIAVLEKGLHYSPVDFIKKADDFKMMLSGYEVGLKKLPFGHKLIDMLDKVDAQKEEIIFATLAKADDPELLKKALKAYFPSSQIKRLPKNFMRVVINKYSLQSKVELLMSVDKKLREHLLEIFAKQGSTARDLMDLEFKNLKENAALKKKMVDQKDEIWKSFMTHLRGFISGDDIYRAEIDKVLNSYSEKLVNGSADPKKVVKLKAVS